MSRKAWQSSVESRGSNEVSASSRRIIRISDSPRNVCSVSRSLSRRIVSKVRPRSMPRNSIDTRCRCALALSQRYPKSTSAVLRPRLNPDCDGDKYSSNFGAILDRTTRDSVFLKVVRRTIGHTLVRGPFGLPGFWISMKVASGFLRGLW